MEAPPIGVSSWKSWREFHPDPTLLTWLMRYEDVWGAVCRYRDAGLEPDPAWLYELGVP